MKDRSHRALPKGWLALCALAFYSSWNCTVSAQLVWGLGGVGGSGTWNTTNVNWWNGTANVAWTDGSSAVFAGSGGTVTSAFPTPRVASLTFDAAGYTIQSGSLIGSTPTLTVVTNQPAAISSTLTSSAFDNTLLKTGPASLTVSGTNFFRKLQLDEGEYVVKGSSSLIFSDVTISNAPGSVLTLAPSFANTDIRSLSGGGIVQPDAQARTVELTLWSSASFRGTAQDNGSGKLAISLFASSQTISFTGANSYSGPTSLKFGTLVFSENGSASNSAAVNISQNGVLRLDNSVFAHSNRVSDVAELKMEGGILEVIGNATQPVDERLGSLRFAGAANISNVQPGSASMILGFAGAIRDLRGTINILGNGGTTWDGITNNNAGIIGAFVTAGDDWATVSQNGRVSALTNYASDINLASASDHVKLLDGGLTFLASSANRPTLNLQNAGAGIQVLDLGSNVLTLAQGGLLSSGIAGTRVQSGTLLVGNNELVVAARNNLEIASVIAETLPGTGLTKSGAGTLTLTGNNSYSGTTVINEGVLAVGSDASLGTGQFIYFGGGTLQATQSFSSSKSLGRTTSRVAEIDTAGFNVSFSGTNSALLKTGPGTLTLTNSSIGSVASSAGTVVLANPATGSVRLSGGTLVASGRLDSLELISSSILDIGGDAPAKLTTTQYSITGSSNPTNTLTVRFGLGATAQDLWTISFISSFSNAEKIFLFDFQDLGGVTTNTPYNLMTVPVRTSATLFGFSPAATAAGWNGTFSSTGTSISVNFVSTPEPQSAALLAMGTLLISGRTRQSRKRRALATL